jgi:hypothetical protein
MKLIRASPDKGGFPQAPNPRRFPQVSRRRRERGSQGPPAGSSEDLQRPPGDSLTGTLYAGGAPWRSPGGGDPLAYPPGSPRVSPEDPMGDPLKDPRGVSQGSPLGDHPGEPPEDPPGIAKKDPPGEPP